MFTLTLTRAEKIEAFDVAIALMTSRPTLTPQVAVPIAVTKVLYRTRRGEIAALHK